MENINTDDKNELDITVDLMDFRNKCIEDGTIDEKVNDLYSGIEL